MARVLAISSQVVRGHVGLSATVFALQRLGHEVWPLPTVLLSNHPGHTKVAGTRIAPDALRGIVNALAGNGWLPDLDAVLTGYLPTAEHVAFAADTITRLKSVGRRPLILIDPVLGDDPKGLYIEETAAVAVRDQLLPLADVITPNRFELAWLSGLAVTGAASAATAAGRLNVARVLATSIPAADAGRLSNVLWSPADVTSLDVPRREQVPHGTGDLLAALYLGHLLKGSTPVDALAKAVAGVRAAIDAGTPGTDELPLVEAQARWSEGVLK